MKTYFGYRGVYGPTVLVSDGDRSQRLSTLSMRQDLRNRSPGGPEWGYGGSGPAQLALALLADATGDDQLALDLHQHFKRAVVSALNRDCWVLTELDILHGVAEMLYDERTDHSIVETNSADPDAQPDSEGGEL